MPSFRLYFQFLSQSHLNEQFGQLVFETLLYVLLINVKPIWSIWSLQAIILLKIPSFKFATRVQFIEANCNKLRDLVVGQALCSKMMCWKKTSLNMRIHAGYSETRKSIVYAMSHYAMVCQNVLRILSRWPGLWHKSTLEELSECADCSLLYWNVYYLL